MDPKHLLSVLALVVLILQNVSAGLLDYGIFKQHFHTNATDSSEKMKEFRYYVSGFDYENRPVVIMDWGKWDMVWVAKQPNLKDHLMKKYKHYVDDIASGNLTRKMSKYLPNGQNCSDDVVIIKNFDGFDIHRIYTPAALKLSMDFLVYMQKCLFRIEYGFMVNSNAIAYQLLDMFKPLAGNFLTKFDVYGTNSEKWVPKVQRKIPLDQLPHSFGGREDFKPLFEESFMQ